MGVKSQADQHLPDESRLDNGLVSTIFRPQDVSVDKSFALLTSLLDRHNAYVLASPSTSHMKRYSARNSIDATTWTESVTSKEAIDDVRRLKYLAKSLLRERIKMTTLDLVDVAEMARHRPSVIAIAA